MSNLDLIEKAVKAVAMLSEDVVFVGGAAAELYVDTVYSEEARVTEDVEIIIDVCSRSGLEIFEEHLRKIGFENDMTPGAPICRWLFQGLKLDIMPIDQSMLGFSNRWYAEGFEKRITRELPSGLEIAVLPIEYYIATKLEAVLHRGADDLRLSHDFEDIVFLLDNSTIVEEALKSASMELKNYIVSTFSQLREKAEFSEAVLCALPFGDEERAGIILDSIKSVCGK